MNQDLGFVHRFEPGDDDLTLLLLHGTGADENDLVPLGRVVAPSAALLSPRGKVLENGMPRFFRRLAMGVFDEEDLKLRTHELAAFVRAAAEAYGRDPQRIVALGYSNGANIGGSLLLLEPGLLAGAALLHAMVPFRLQTLPDLTGTSVIVTGGHRDPMIPADQTQELARMLTSAGAEVELLLGPGGHELAPPEVEKVAEWLGAISPQPT
ncbi:MAG: dienelactone hydrolase family protein [Actinomycetota bacterium]|nr:dienelactone hydrolase family protein [Actinomycetota bacterium]